jgi:hypothetical protein
LPDNDERFNKADCRDRRQHLKEFLAMSGYADQRTADPKLGNWKVYHLPCEG